MKCVIIGGVAGGASAAARLRRNDEQAEIVLFERGGHVSYASCGLPYYIGGSISRKQQLFVQTPESLYANLRIDVRCRTEVLGIDRKAKEVWAKDLATGTEYAESYEKLILSPGAEPVVPPIPGIGSLGNIGHGIFTLRNLPDTDAIAGYIKDRKPKRAVIIGAGFIGMEMAENLYNKGLFVTIVEMLDQVMSILDYEMAAEVHQHLKAKGVEFFLKDGVSRFEPLDGGNTGIRVVLSSARRLNADLVILSIGVRPETKLAKDAGLSIGTTGGVQVDEYLRSSDRDIYAIGDAVEVTHFVTRKPALIPLAGPANKQGRIVADNIAFGDTHDYKGSIGTGIAKIFDLTVASTGASEKLLTKEGISHVSVNIHSANHAGYYPGAQPISMKLLFSPESGKLLGAQAVGYEGVDKRIDIIAALLGTAGTVRDLMAVEHAYAPPYSSAKDLVNMAGFVAENIMNGLTTPVYWQTVVDNEKRNGYFLLDVRTKQEFNSGAIPGAVNIPQAELRERISEIPTDRPVLVYCAVGIRAYRAERILKQRLPGSVKVYNLSGGYKTYSFVSMKQGNEDLFEGDRIGKDDMIYDDSHDIGLG